ncbi:MAG: DNA polymerase III subunit gamma/tau, partial [Clostridia bacterium]|nr:DNA polymerase III subunit gamma/tau [Clostridia bacterium]
EMDAASNNGVDAVRNMKDEIAFTPALLKYRVYIIDEVHMMSSSAFNALLKTLEEPPHYVIFILATTEFNKLPTTIVSRCQRFDFKRISSEVIIERLKKIAAAEGISLTDDGARVIARVARGGLRDAVSLLELCAGGNRKVDAPLVFETVGSGNRDNAYKIISAVASADFRTIYSIINDTVMTSGDLSVFWQEIIDAYRDIMVVKTLDGACEYLDLTELEYKTVLEISKSFTLARLAYHTTLLEGAMADMARAFNSKRSIAEITLTRMCDLRLGSSPEALATRIEELEKKLSRMELSAGAAPTVSVREEQVAKPAPIAPQQPKPMPKEAPVTRASVPYSKWQLALERIGEVKVSLPAQFLRSEAYKLGDGEFVIKMNEFFAQKFESSSSDVAILKGVLASLEGLAPADIRIKVVPLGYKVDDAMSELENMLK